MNNNVTIKPDIMRLVITNLKATFDMKP
ncbi:uncharacterized protein METZ01_LOCUS81647 [marine metagenome]|uniref:Uncharacterized protein n=1 Tax=marine metagenome TaxID=408172 RepID=A0A381UPN7_9ZZZZ